MRLFTPKTFSIPAIACAFALLPFQAIAHSDALTLEQVSDMFAGANTVSDPKIVPCTLSGGTETVCFSITVKHMPDDYTAGPWCPTSVTDGPGVSGIWLDSGQVFHADGAFMSGLASFYDDDKWKMVDPETGKINVTDTLEKCDAAARPDVDPKYQNHCVECQPSYIDADATQTYVIPMIPTDHSGNAPTNFSGSGVAINGVRLDGPAPVDAILGAYTIAPFDDCGGHVNLHAGYHYHAVTDCLNDTAAQGTHAGVIGLAMDGYQIMTHALADGTLPTDLDQCNGHDTDGAGYHYHAGAAGSNAILGCLSAETGCILDDPDQTCDASKTRRRPRP